MIFEKNPFTTAVSIPKSFHLTPEAPTLKNINQPYYCMQSIDARDTHHYQSFISLQIFQKYLAL